MKHRVLNGLMLGIFIFGTYSFAGEQFTMSAEDRAMYEDMDNPAEIDVEEAEEIFDTKLGGEKYLASFLGVPQKELTHYLAGFPRYIKKLKNVVGIDQVMQVIQVEKGKPKEALDSEEMYALVAYVKGLANDENITIDIDANKNMKEAYVLGKELFEKRRGKRGLSCLSCHQTDGVILRTQRVPHLGSIGTGATWPAYRMTKGKMRSMQKRFQGCMEDSLQASLPLGSKEMVALEVYLTHEAKEKQKVIAVPGLKR